MNVEIEPKKLLIILKAALSGLSPSGRGYALDLEYMDDVQKLTDQLTLNLIESNSNERRCVNCGECVEWNNAHPAAYLGWIHTNSRFARCYPTDPVAMPYPLEAPA